MSDVHNHQRVHCTSHTGHPKVGCQADKFDTSIPCRSFIIARGILQGGEGPLISCVIIQFPSIRRCYSRLYSKIQDLGGKLE